MPLLVCVRMDHALMRLSLSRLKKKLLSNAIINSKLVIYIFDIKNLSRFRLEQFKILFKWRIFRGLEGWGPILREWNYNK